MSIDDPGQFWIGNPGALIEMKCPSGIERKFARAMSTTTTAAGGQRAYLGSRTLRQWTINLGLLSSDQVGALAEFIAAYDPPYVMVDLAAAVTNLLTIPQSACMEWVSTATPATSRSGRWPMDNGSYAASSLAIPSQGTVKFGPVPVVPNMPVTGSAWVACPTATQGGATVSLQWLNTQGQQLGSLVTGDSVAGMDVLRRATVSAAQPPTNAAAVALHVQGAQAAARPAISWTPDVADWHIGGGAPTVVVAGLDETVQMALSDGSRYMAGATCDIIEVG